MLPACDTGILDRAGPRAHIDGMQGIVRAARHLALIALLLRAMIPIGWMPDAQAGVTVCSPDIAIGVIHHDGAPGHDGGADHQNSHEECPFAAAPHLASTPDMPQIALPPVHAAAAVFDGHRAALIAARFTPQSPRAPPRNV
jgi:hypothetical protein